MNSLKKEKDKSSMIVPVAIAALGVAAVFTLLYLLTESEDNANREEDVDGIENYDLVNGAPFIFAQK